MRPDPVISGAWVKAALVILVAGALGAGAYLLATGVDIHLPDLNKSTGDAQTTLSSTTLDHTTIGDTTTPPPATHSIAQLQELGRCTQAANGDLDKINTCFDRFNRGQ